MVQKALKTGKQDMTSIYDVLDAAGEGATNILVQGKIYKINTVFTGVCLSTPRRIPHVHPIILHWPHVLSGAYPGNWL